MILLRLSFSRFIGMANFNVNLFCLVTSPIVFVDLSKSSNATPFTAKAPDYTSTAIVLHKSWLKATGAAEEKLNNLSRVGSTISEDMSGISLTASVSENLPHQGAQVLPEDVPQANALSENLSYYISSTEQNKEGVAEDLDPQSKPIFEALPSTESTPRSSIDGHVGIRQSILDSIEAEESRERDPLVTGQAPFATQHEGQEAIQVHQTPCTPKLVTVGGKSKEIEPSSSGSPTSLDSGIGMESDEAPTPSLGSPTYESEHKSMPQFQTTPTAVPSLSMPRPPLVLTPIPWISQSPVPAIAVDVSSTEVDTMASENEPSPEKEVVPLASHLNPPLLRLIPATEPSTPVNPVEGTTLFFSPRVYSDARYQSHKKTAYADSFSGTSCTRVSSSQNTDVSRVYVDTRGGSHTSTLPFGKRTGRRRGQIPVVVGSDTPQNRPRLITASTFPPSIDSAKANASPVRGCRSSTLPQGSKKGYWKDIWGSLNGTDDSPTKVAPSLKNKEVSSSLQSPFARKDRSTKASMASAPPSPLGIQAIPDRGDLEPSPNDRPPVPRKDSHLIRKALQLPRLAQFDPETRTPPPGASFVSGGASSRQPVAGLRTPERFNRCDDLSFSTPQSQLGHRGRTRSEASLNPSHPSADSQASHSQDSAPAAKSSRVGRPDSPHKHSHSEQVVGPGRRLNFNALAEWTSRDLPMKPPAVVPGPDQSFLLSPLSPLSPFTSLSPLLPSTPQVSSEDDVEDEDFRIARDFYMSAPSKVARERSGIEAGIVI